MRTTSGRLLSTTSALVLTTAVAPAWAAPPTATATYTAPYSGFAATHNNTDDCLPGATCALGEQSWVKPDTGHYSAHVTYSRPDTAAELEPEVAHGTASQNVAFKVPARASKVTAVFTWRVIESAVSAKASSGEVIAQNGLTASVFCDTGCTAEGASVAVQAQRSEAGVGAPVSTYISGDTVVLTATATATPTGRLPRHLYFRGNAYGAVFARETTFCTGSGCVGAGNAHAGTGSARLQAELTEVRISAE